MERVRRCQLLPLLTNKEMMKKSSGRAPVLQIESKATRMDARTVETSGFKVEAKREMFVPRFDGAPSTRALTNKSVTMVTPNGGGSGTAAAAAGLRRRQRQRQSISRLCHQQRSLYAKPKMGGALPQRSSISHSRFSMR